MSGLAAGIDAAAHRGALEGNGRTLAVIGTGVDRIYPAANAGLRDRIAERGAVISPFEVGQPPSKTTFPARNVLIAGLTRVSLLVELAERSGTRIEATIAQEQGKPVLLCWCVREKLIVRNPVTAAKVPKSSDEPVELRPWTEDELESVYLAWRERDHQLADVLLVMAWTGIRWGEARAMTVDDVVEVPTPGLMVRRSQPEGLQIKSTKSRSSRRVPVANRVLPLVRRMVVSRKPGELLLTTSGGAQLHRTRVLATVKWSVTGQGRRLHDLRHTAACLWLARGVDPGTVQAWMGHESIATTNRYLHFLGTSADLAGLDRLNQSTEARGYAGGTRQASDGEEQK